MTFTQHLLHWGIPFVIASSYGLLATQDDLRLAVPMLVGVTAVVASLLALVLYAGEKGILQWSPLAIMLVALGLRLPFLFRPPELSDDLYRYLWDGLRILAGHNPYTVAPADAHPDSALLALVASQVNHPSMVTIYPPAAQILFAAGAALGGGILGLKGFLVGMDLLMCFFILKMLHALRLPPWRAVLYAWHPLPIFEIAASGHIDGAGMLLALICFFLLLDLHADRPSDMPATGFSRIFSHQTVRHFVWGCLFCCASLVKLFPAIFLPGFLLLLPRLGKVVFGIGFIIAGACLTVVFLPDIQNELTTLGTYAQSWEFSGFIYRMLRRGSWPGSYVRWITSATFLLAVAFLYRDLRMEKGQSAGGASAGNSRQASFPALRVLDTFYGISAAFLLLTPTLFPWYALYLAALLPFAAGPGGLILTWSVFLAYRILIPYTLLGRWIENTWTPAAIWLAPVAGFLLCALARKSAKSK